MFAIDPSYARTLRYFFIILLVSIGVKLYAAQLLVWEVDYVPVVARGQAWLQGGDFPAVGTLSSVAAYNMPFLVWLQIPVGIFTRDVALILILTQLLFNIISTWYVYRLGSEFFRPIIGLIAAGLFTFSDVGISSAYTAWAQLLLPGFYVMVAYSLFRWKLDNSTHYVALIWILTTAAFMTHFSAVLLYGVIIVLWVILRLPINWRGLLIGVVVSILMLTPYMLIQVERDFVDLKAFFTRQTTIDRETLDEFTYLKPENQGRNQDPPNSTSSTNDSAQSNNSEPDTPPTEPSRIERGIGYVMSIPAQMLDGLRLVFTTDLQNLRAHLPILHSISVILRIMLEIMFWGGIVLAVYRYIRAVLMRYSTFPKDQRLLRHRLKLLVNTLVGTTAGRNLILLLFILGIIAGLLLVRAGPAVQATYYTGLISLQFVMCAYAIIEITELRRYTPHAVILVIMLISLNGLDRVVRVANHDKSVYSPFNIALYSSINSATRWIADDWDGDDTITVSYDVMPEMAGQWWVAAWHTVDESYRMGMAYDYLLEAYYGLHNQNNNPVGLADDPDYIVTFTSAIHDYDDDDYAQEIFGAIVVLKPVR